MLSSSRSTCIPDSAAIVARDFATAASNRGHQHQYHHQKAVALEEQEKAITTAMLCKRRRTTTSREDSKDPCCLQAPLSPKGITEIWTGDEELLHQCCFLFSSAASSATATSVVGEVEASSIEAPFDPSVHKNILFHSDSLNSLSSAFNAESNRSGSSRCNKKTKKMMQHHRFFPSKPLLKTERTRNNPRFCPSTFPLFFVLISFFALFTFSTAFSDDHQPQPLPMEPDETTILLRRAMLLAQEKQQREAQQGPEHTFLPYKSRRRLFDPVSRPVNVFGVPISISASSAASRRRSPPSPRSLSSSLASMMPPAFSSLLDSDRVDLVVEKKKPPSTDMMMNMMPQMMISESIDEKPTTFEKSPTFANVDKEVDSEKAFSEGIDGASQQPLMKMDPVVAGEWKKALFGRTGLLTELFNYFKEQHKSGLVSAQKPPLSTDDTASGSQPLPMLADFQRFVDALFRKRPAPEGGKGGSGDFASANVNANEDPPLLPELPFIGICNRLNCGDIYKAIDQFRRSEMFTNFQTALSLLHDPKGWDIIGDLLANPELIEQYLSASSSSAGKNRELGELLSGRTGKDGTGGEGTITASSVDGKPIDAASKIKNTKGGEKGVLVPSTIIAANIDAAPDYYSAVDQGVPEVEEKEEIATAVDTAIDDLGGGEALEGDHEEVTNNSTATTTVVAVAQTGSSVAGNLSTRFTSIIPPSTTATTPASQQSLRTGPALKATNQMNKEQKQGSELNVSFNQTRKEAPDTNQSKGIVTTNQRKGAGPPRSFSTASNQQQMKRGEPIIKSFNISRDARPVEGKKGAEPDFSSSSWLLVDRSTNQRKQQGAGLPLPSSMVKMIGGWDGAREIVVEEEPESESTPVDYVAVVASASASNRNNNSSVKNRRRPPLHEGSVAGTSSLAKAPKMLLHRTPKEEGHGGGESLGLTPKQHLSRPSFPPSPPLKKVNTAELPAFAASIDSYPGADADLLGGGVGVMSLEKEERIDGGIAVVPAGGASKSSVPGATASPWSATTVTSSSSSSSTSPSITISSVTQLINSTISENARKTDLESSTVTAATLSRVSYMTTVEPKQKGEITVTQSPEPRNFWSTTVKPKQGGSETDKKATTKRNFRRDSDYYAMYYDNENNNHDENSKRKRGGGTMHAAMDFDG